MSLQIDHLILLVPDREAACDDLERRLGVRPVLGGRHPRFGTHNALLSLGDATYLEVMAHDPSLPAPEDGVLFDADRVTSPRLATWVVATDDIRQASVRAGAAGVPLGEVSPAQRELPDGETLTWFLTDPRTDRHGGVVPFLIEWGDTPHPAASAPRGGSLERLEIGHPDPHEVAAALGGLGLEYDVDEAPTPTLRATLRTPAGDLVTIA